MAVSKQTSDNKRSVHVRLEGDDYAQLEYWARREGISMSEFAGDAIKMYIAHKCGDFDLPTLEAQRLNQLIDGIAVLSSNVGSLESIVVHGFDSLLGLTKGDNYLLEEEDGEVF